MVPNRFEILKFDFSSENAKFAGPHLPAGDGGGTGTGNWTIQGIDIHLIV